MRWLLLVALIAGCSDESPAGGVGTGGSSAGGSGQAGTAGGGSGGTGGTMATSGTGGSGFDAGLSCAIPMDQVSGTDTQAVINRANGDVHCTNQTITVPIVNGTYYDTSWTLTNYSSSPVLAPGMCSVAFSYTRKVNASTCGVPQGTESLYVTFLVPGI